MRKGKQASAGFSLIEVMVTLILLTIGILGLVAMQGRGIQQTSDAVQRNNAIMLGNELIELVRANPTARDSYLLKELPAKGACDLSASTKINETSKQLTCWANKVRVLMPEAETLKDEFYVCRSQTPGSCANGAGLAIEVQIAWRATAEGCLDDSAPANSDPSICRLRVRGEL